MGSIRGVTATRSGWRGNLEVVRVDYDPAVVSFEKLFAQASKFDCASAVFTYTDEQHEYASEKIGKKAVKARGLMRDVATKEQKYYVRKSPFGRLPLTALQASMINGELYTGGTPEKWLSPRQQELLGFMQKSPSSVQKILLSLSWPDDDSKLIAFENKVLNVLKGKANEKDELGF